MNSRRDGSEAVFCFIIILFTLFCAYEYHKHIITPAAEHITNIKEQR